MSPVDSVDIVVLSEHVDYWDGTGWHDRFSSRQYTNRQLDYVRKFKLESAYTPQMVIDGTREFVGNDDVALMEALQTAASTAKAVLEVQAERSNRGVITVKAKAGPLPPGCKAADLYLAIADNLEETRVGGGENSGRYLYHVSVARSLRRIGTIPITGGQLQFTVEVGKGMELEKQRVVVFLEEFGTGRVLAAAQRRLK
jgi:hypothetical protein